MMDIKDSPSSAELGAKEFSPPSPGEELPSKEEAPPLSREAQLQAEAAQLKDQLLRSLAEMENVRRRALKEKEEASKYAITGFSRDLLVVADNLRRALESVARMEEGQDALKNIVEGIEMTEREMLNVFEKVGIRKITPLGDKFDHAYHQAMLEVENKDHPPGTVVQVFQPGYILQDRLLRPAMVAVAKGEPQQQPTSAS